MVQSNASAGGRGGWGSTRAEAWGLAPKQALDTAQNPGIFARRKVRKTTRQERRQHPILPVLQPPIEAGVFDLAGKTRAEAMHQMMDEVS